MTLNDRWLALQRIPKHCKEKYREAIEEFPPLWLIPAVVIVYLFISIFMFGKAHAEKIINWNALIPAVIMAESGGNPNAISEDDCTGLMQISPIVLKEWNMWAKEKYQRIDLWNKFVNFEVGTWYLHRIWEYYLPFYNLEQNLDNLLIAYNWGIGNLIKYRSNDIKKLPKETERYIQKIKEIMARREK